ncbi:hypothetical protein [Pseudomonas sp. B14(2017)]|uniref:phage nozzle protein n=1 Tax=Pseudomonas sp. B14(2017) TaxID=1981745 RepID=UPI000A1F8D4C|nr:hypothetical protein [Pseudomonas sp. B14(2017)]
MGLVSQSIKNLKGGISQQPDILRYANQGVAQVNGWSSETEGLQKRPPTKFVKYLNPVDHWTNNPYVHLINRDAQEQYLVICDGAGISVVDLLGNAYTVRNYNGYANCSNPREDLRMVTVADYTFITNRKAVVGLGPTVSQSGYPALNRRAIINVRGGQYGRTLTVTINGVQLASLTIANGSVATDVSQTDAQWIAQQLATQIVTHAGYGAVAGAGYVMITTPEDITSISTADGYAGQLINGFTYQVQTFSKLPAQCVPGYIVEITGENTAAGDNYWVMYDGVGMVWKETVAPGVITDLNNLTMPHALVRAADGQFDWTPLSWGTRTSGDDDTNPFPSFLDGTINDVFFFRNRLGFLSGENVIMSRTAKYFDFFPASVAALSDDDPIDVAISHNRISILKYAVPFSEQLLLWSDQAQFVLTASGVLSAKNIQLDLTTEFDVSDNARPFGVGRGVYFAAPRASYASIKRYYAVQDVSDVKDAEDISAHVPNYVPNNVYAIHGSGTENFITVLSDSAKQVVFIYKFLYLDQEIAEQSWSHWDMGEGVEVLSAQCIGSFMWMILRRPGGITLERLDFTRNSIDVTGEPYRAYMDMKAPVTPAAYYDDDYRSVINLSDAYGFIPTSGDFWTLSDDGVFQLHEEPVGGWASVSGQIFLDGDVTGRTFVLGMRYEFLYGFSKLLIKQTADDGSSTTEDIGRLQLRRAWVNYENSGAFDISVDNGYTEYVYTMSGARLGDREVGQQALGTGQFRFPVSGNAQNQTLVLTSDSPVPVNIIGCGWEANYLRRSSGI